MRLSPAGLAFIKKHEGFSPTRYDDGVGVRTIGYGTTAADVDPLPSYLTEPQASRLLARKLAAKYEPSIRALFARRGPLHDLFTQGRYDALVSLVYNLGIGAVPAPRRWAPASGFETLGRAILRRDIKAIADALLLYSNPGDPAVHAGLLARRRAEAAMFLAEDPIAFTRYEQRLMMRYLASSTRLALRAQARRIQLAARATPGGWDRQDRTRRFRALRARAIQP